MVSVANIEEKAVQSDGPFFLVCFPHYSFIELFLLTTENPCPHLGNIVTIKLSEDDEVVTLPDGSTVTKIVETHFQMNYQAGEWKRIKKYRKAEDNPATTTAAAPV